MQKLIYVTGCSKLPRFDPSFFKRLDVGLLALLRAWRRNCDVQSDYGNIFRRSGDRREGGTLKSAPCL
eukprot:3484934-Pleurochrysis_carterae.AAC.3